MSLEGQLLDQKSLRAVTGKTADWNEIAKDCIAFANATGGRLLLGIEDGQDAAASQSTHPADLPDTIRRKLASAPSTLAVLPMSSPPRMAASTSSCASHVLWPWHPPPTAATSCAWPTKASPLRAMT
jgi:hypothetical protein